MTEYITVADVDAKLGPAWTTADKKASAVMMANVWLTGKSLPGLDPIPDEWIQAGAEIAREAAAGKVYGQTETGLLSKSVSADTVSSAKTFAANHKVMSAGETFALALLAPWLGNSSMIKLVRA